MKIILSVIAVSLVMITVSFYIPTVKAELSRSDYNLLDRYYADKDHKHCGLGSNSLFASVSCEGHSHTHDHGDEYASKRKFNASPKPTPHPVSAFSRNQVELFKVLISKCKVNFDRTLSCEID